MRWQSSNNLWRRREVQLLLLALFLVAVTSRFYVWWNYRGPVTLEFMGIGRPEKDEVTGTVAIFKLRNQSGVDITYPGVRMNYPFCQAELLVSERPQMIGGSLMPAGAGRGYPGSLTNWFVLRDGDECEVRCEIWGATNQWRLKLDYREGSVDGPLARLLPSEVGRWLATSVKDLPERTAESQPVEVLIPSSITKLLTTLYPEGEWQESVVKTNANGSVITRLELVPAAKAKQRAD